MGSGRRSVGRPGSGRLGLLLPDRGLGVGLLRTLCWVLGTVALAGLGEVG